MPLQTSLQSVSPRVYLCSKHLNHKSLYLTTRMWKNSSNHITESVLNSTYVVIHMSFITNINKNHNHHHKRSNNKHNNKHNTIEVLRSQPLLWSNALIRVSSRRLSRIRLHLHYNFLFSRKPELLCATIQISVIRPQDCFIKLHSPQPNKLHSHRKHKHIQRLWHTFDFVACAT